MREGRLRGREPLPGARTAGSSLAGQEERHGDRTDRARRVHDDAWFHRL
jgi:hypothetical protein